MDQLGFLWSTDTEDCESQWYMMPIRMRGNCRLHRHLDKLPPPPWGPSSETRFHEVMLSLRVLSAVDLDCSLPHGHGQGCHEIEAWNTKAQPHQEAVGGSTLRLCGIWSYGAIVMFWTEVCMFLTVPYYTTWPNPWQCLHCTMIVFSDWVLVMFR